MPIPEPAATATHVNQAIPCKQLTLPGRWNPGETSWGTAQATHRIVGNNKLLFHTIKFQGCLLPEKTTSMSKVIHFYPA